MATARGRSPRLRKDPDRTVQLRERDLRALEVLQGLQVARLDDLSLLLSHLGGKSTPMRIRTTRSIIARWVHSGYAQTIHNPRGGLGMAASTALTHRVVGTSRLPHGSPAWRDIPHALTVSAVAIHLLTQTQGCWISDAHLAASGAQGHRVDGVLTLPNDQAIAIEVERTTKSANRWQANLAITLDRYPQVAYYCTDATARHLSAWAHRSLTSSDRQRVTIRALGVLAR